MERFNPKFFELSDRQKVEGAHEVHVHELRLRMGSAIGRAPPIDGVSFAHRLIYETLHILSGSARCVIVGELFYSSSSGDQPENTCTAELLAMPLIWKAQHAWYIDKEM